MPAFRHAWRYPGAIPETDVRVTADGALVCVHDSTLARTTNASPEIAARPIAELTLAEVQAVDAGVRFGEAYRGERVPTFDELLAEMVKQPGRRLYVEPKAVDLHVLRAKLEEYGVTDRVIYVSGSPQVLSEIQRVFPGAPAMTWAGGPPEVIREGVDQWLRRGAADITQLQLHLPVTTVEPGAEPVYALDDAYLAATQRRLQDADIAMQLRPFAVTPGALRRFLEMGIRWYVADAPAGLWHDLALALQSETEGPSECIYHIAPLRDWLAALERGAYRAASLETEGFIHCSTREQALRVANAVFRSEAELVILCIDPRAVQAVLRFEPPVRRDDAFAAEQFPHVYGALPLHAVLALTDLARGADGGFVWPDRFAW